LFLVVKKSFAFDGREAAEELLQDVREDRRFFLRDAVLREQDEEFAEDATSLRRVKEGTASRAPTRDPPPGAYSSAMG
jgi:hypothetical protein